MIFPRLGYFVIIVCFLMLYPFGNIQAFDGKREGFFFGIGVEPGMSIDRTAYSDGSSYFYGRPSFTLNYRIGYAPSEQFLIYFTGRSTLNGLYNYSFDEGDFDNSSDIFSDGTSGLGFMFFPNRSSDFYLTGCLGLSTSIYLNEPDIENVLIGIGMSGGIGYEISPNLTVDVMLDYRRFSDTYEDSYFREVIDYTVDIVTFSLAFNFLLY